MNEKIRPIEALRFTTLDGKERRFLLTMGGIRRIKSRFQVKTLGEFMNQDAAEVGIPLLYEALQDKGDLTEDEFAELLPAHMETIAKLSAELLGASFPENPTAASQLATDRTQIQ